MYLPQGFFLFLSPGAASSSSFRPTKNGLFFRKWIFCAIFYILRSFCRPLVLGRQGPQHRRLNFIHVENELFYFLPFLPAAKLTCHRKVRVVVGGDYFEVMALQVDLRSRSSGQLNPCGLLSSPYLPPIFSSGGICQNKSRTVAPWPDFSSGWDPSLKQISLRGGISSSHLYIPILWHLSGGNLWI